MKGRKQKGITLIALVVTIIVLLILAGITINLAFNNNGILKRAENAKEQNEATAKKEQQILQDIDNAIEGYVPTPPIKVKQGEKATANGTIDGKAPNAYNPIIPKGYYPIEAISKEVPESNTTWGDGSSAPTEENVNKGLVITDNLSNGNEWVWVPVENPKDYYNTEGKVGERTLYGTDVVTERYTKSVELWEGATDEFKRK